MAQDILYRLNYVYGGDGTSNDTRPTDNYDLNYNFGDEKALIKPAARYRGGLSIFLSSLGSLSLATLPEGESKDSGYYFTNSMWNTPHHRPNGQSLPPRGSQVNKAINIAPGESQEMRL